VQLRNAVSVASEAAHPDGAVVERIAWVPAYQDEETVTEFCEATDPSGNLESNSSAGHKEYQDRLRAIALRQEGKEKAEIAALLDRPVKFVERWWRKDAHEVPKPAGVHEFLKVEFWRDIEIVRGFGAGLTIYDEILLNTEWVQPMANGANFKDGGSRLKYDKEGRMRPQGNQNAKDGLVPGRMPKLDRLVQKLLSEKDIDDRVLKRPGLLWYPDGTATAIPHRHECWTALMSFGAPRILTIDNHPVLLRDGDLIIFGTQRHGVPKMRDPSGAFDSYGGRISAVFFFMPQGKQAEGAEPWRAILDGGLGDATDRGVSRKASAMLQDAALGAGAAVRGLATGAKAEEVGHLVDLGFSEREAAAALKATNFDLERAAEVLLGGGGPALLLCADEDAQQIGGDALGLPAAGGIGQQKAQLYARLDAIYKRRRSQERLETDHSGAAAATAAASAGDDDSSSGEVTTQDDDASLARRLQERENAWVGFGNCDLCDALAGEGDGGDWEEVAILQQLEELEMHDTSAASSGEALRRTFEQYDEMLEAQEAEEWDGRGDLMVREWRRLHLQIEQQEPCTVYALGCGGLREQVFFELLSLHSVRVLYDFRPNAEASPGRHFVPEALKLACRARGLVYRHIALGREGAYGILKHLREDEGRNALAELVWYARRKHAAFLGAQEDWRDDYRIAIAARLREAGHKVMHILTDGSLEEHPEAAPMPDNLVNEEQRLRLLEKQRQAGEARRPQKSAVSRSSEVVALKLAQPQKEIDVGAELRKAETQAELVRTQRRLADLQRRSETADGKAGLGPKLLNVTKWVHEESEQQKSNLAAGKTKDGKEKGKATAGGSAPSYVWLGTGGTDGGNPLYNPAARSGGASSSSAPAPTGGVERPASAAGGGGAPGDVAAPLSAAAPEELFVECLGCGVGLPWDALAPGDGRCPECVAGLVATSGDAGSSDTQRGEAQASAASSTMPQPSADCAAIAVEIAPRGEAAQAEGGEASSSKRRSTWRSQRHARRAGADV